jgi:hypothetical protein
LLRFQIAADELEIDADLAAASNCVKGRSVRMGQVETDRICARLRGQRGFSMSGVTEGEALRCSVQIAAEECPEYSTSYDKACAVSAEVESVRSRSFIDVQSVPGALHLPRALIQSRSPDMYCPTIQAQSLGWR